MASPSEPPKPLTLSATYTSPTNAPFTLAHTLEPPPSGTTAPTVPDKTAYLAALRAATAGLQEQINKELTQRMDEDNNNNSAKKVDDARAEENYGEEEGQEDVDE